MLSAAAAAAAPAVRSQFLPLVPRWSAALPAPSLGAPAMTDGAIVVALQDGGVLALRASDGAVAWRAELAAVHPPAADAERAYVATRDAVHALSLASGEPVWRVETGLLTAPPLVRSGWLVTASAAGVGAYRASDGAAVWQRDFGTVDASVAIDGDVLFVPLLDRRLLAVDLPSGNGRWQTRLGGDPAAPLAIAGKVYALAGDKYFYVLDADNGEIEWTLRVGAAPRGRPAVDDAHIYFVAMDNVLRALDRGHGAIRWLEGLPFRPFAGPALLGSALIVPGPVAALPVFGRDGKRIGAVTVASSLVAMSETRTDPAGYPVVATVTGDLEHPWTLTLLQTSLDPPPIPLVDLTAVPGQAIPFVLPG